MHRLYQSHLICLLVFISVLALITVELQAQVQFRDSYSAQIIARELAVKSTLTVEADEREFQINDIEGRIEYALSLIVEEEFDEALLLLNEAETILEGQEPLSTLSHKGISFWNTYVEYLIGTCHAKIGNLDLASEYYKIVIDDAPYYSDAYNDLALLLLDQGRFDSADYYFDAGLTANSNNSYLIHNKALCSFYQRRVFETYSLLKRNTEVNPDFLPSYYLLASIKDFRGDERGARELYSLAIERNPDSSEPFLFQARFYYWSQKYAKAKKSCISALDIEPDNNGASELLGMSQVQSGDYSSGIKQMATAFLEENPSEKVMLDNLVFADWEVYDLLQSVVSENYSERELNAIGEFAKNFLLSPNSKELSKSTDRFFSANPRSILAKRLNLLSQSAVSPNTLNSDLVGRLGS
ncbi:MAG: tetratricopeptide repeat protein, partial [Bacteroidota bacterium]